MDVLGKLESRLDQLLAVLASLRAENLRLQDELAVLKRENIKLTQENGTLRETIARQDELRLVAYGRLEDVVRRIRDYGAVVSSDES